ncbi:helix-turn-helix domain-containing protein [Leptospira adleri]|uniref:Helix-turn-helix domain-containing protein n=1 Tax=Leptospira adleri TaxID=2023186 RepID=A0A2M9YJA3_9LEPT|nr:helix-turn-helix domain-containing protein [Leptospira adleri]PJZ51625.1 helix-turn-helix domain-containing protein [Leptospira adleri]PJZ61866.1 helix-turn-helix domain-containing protein [Leptospira adleri]
MKELIYGEFIPRTIINTKLGRGMRDVLAKITLLDINGRIEGRGGCYAGNEYLGQVLGMATTTIAKYISRLRKAGYINQVSFNGRIRVIQSSFHDAVIFERAQYQISKTAVQNDPSQNSTDGKGRGVRDSKSAKDKRSAPVRTKEERAKTVNLPGADKLKPTWSDFQPWYKDRLTKSSIDILDNLQFEFVHDKLIILCGVPNSLKMIIEKFFTEEVVTPIQVVFREQHKERTAA